MRGIVLGSFASFFFAVTFILNRAMELSGGSWIWSAVLRYLFMLPPLFLIVAWRGNLRALLTEMRKEPWVWLGWSSVGFGLFYAPLCFAAAYGPAWIVASTWQLTIIAGSLLAPLFYVGVATPQGIRKVRARIPRRGVAVSLVILVGVVIIQGQNQRISVQELVLGMLPVLLAAFAYPLGNRKMMVICQGSLDTYQRVLGMTLASLPFWLVLAGLGYAVTGAPSGMQMAQSLVVALSSGVIATILFFTATDLARGDLHRLAAVEATQAGEVVFALLGEVVILHGSFPGIWSLLGIALVVLGMVLHSFLAKDSGPAIRNIDRDIGIG